MHDAAFIAIVSRRRSVTTATRAAPSSPAPSAATASSMRAPALAPLRTAAAPCNRRAHRQVNGFVSPQHDQEPQPTNDAYLVHKLCCRQRRNLPKPHVAGSNRLSVARSELQRHLKLHGSRRYRRCHSVRHKAARNVLARSVADVLVDRLSRHQRSRNQTYVVAASTLFQTTDVLTHRRR